MSIRGYIILSAHLCFSQQQSQMTSINVCYARHFFTLRSLNAEDDRKTIIRIQILFMKDGAIAAVNTAAVSVQK